MSPRVIEGHSIWSTRARGIGEWFVRRNKANLKGIDGTNEECMNKDTVCIGICSVTKSDKMLVDELEDRKKGAVCLYRSRRSRRVIWRRHINEKVCKMRGGHSMSLGVWKAKDNILSGMRNCL